MKTSFLALLALTLSGCGTIASKYAGQNWGTPYSGARCTFEVVQACAANAPLWPLLPFALIDVGLSATADTLLLPVDLPMDRKKFGDYCNVGQAFGG